MSNDQTRGNLDIREILSLLPHRFPFLLLDRVVRCEPGRYISGIKNVSRGDPMLVGEGNGVLPHLIVVEALAQLSVVLTMKTLMFDRDEEPMFFFAGIDDATLGTHVFIGDVLLLESSAMRIKIDRGLGKFRTRASVAGECVIEATLIAAMRARH